MRITIPDVCDSQNKEHRESERYIEDWIHENTFYCPHLQARITNMQCSMNRERVRTNGTHDRTVHPCISCEHEKNYEIYQGNSKGEQGMTSSKTEHRTLIEGLEDCEIHVPGTRASDGIEQFASFYKNKTIGFSKSILKKIPKDARYFIIGFDYYNNKIKIKIFNEQIKNSQKMHREQKTCHVSGAINNWHLYDKLGKRFAAEFIPEKNLIEIDLGEEQ